MELALRYVLCMYLGTTSDFCFTQYKHIDFVGMFANYEERLLVLSCLSVRPHGTTWLPRSALSCNLVLEYFSKICREKYKRH